MKDHFAYHSPLGPLGRIADRLFLRKYMKDLLLRRNEVLKEVAERGGDREGLQVLSSAT
jgi:hypothetical protein